MKSKIKKFLKDTVRQTLKTLNYGGNQRQCYVCKRRLRFFTKFQGGSRAIPELQRRLEIIGSDVDNFGCVYCDSHDRERHLFMYFDQAGLWERARGSRILHFAPERNLALRFAAGAPSLYVRADLFPQSEDIKSIDATNIPYPEGSFDILIANHILEHIPNYRAALREFHRVLRPGAIAILQTPYSRLLEKTFEDKNINTDALRLFFHGQSDHVRTFSESDLFQSLQESGFELRMVKHDDCFDDAATLRYGVNPREDLIRVAKPAAEGSE